MDIVLHFSMATLATSIDQLQSESASSAPSEHSRHTVSPESVGASVTTWFASARLDLSRPALFAVTIVGAFALGLILVTIALALLPAAR